MQGAAATCALHLSVAASRGCTPTAADPRSILLPLPLITSRSPRRSRSKRLIPIQTNADLLGGGSKRKLSGECVSHDRVTNTHCHSQNARRSAPTSVSVCPGVTNPNIAARLNKHTGVAFARMIHFAGARDHDVTMHSRSRLRSCVTRASCQVRRECVWMPQQCWQSERAR